MTKMHIIFSSSRPHESTAYLYLFTTTMATFLITTTLFTIGSAILERRVLKNAAPLLFEPSQVMPPLSRSFGLTIFILTGFSFWLFMWGMQIGKAREKYKELAKKDGEKPEHVESFSLPNMYATGNSEHAKAFNSIQRSHQHTFETITQIYTGALVGALMFPITSAIITFLWAFGRTQWAKSYAANGPSGRYNNPVAMLVWRGFLANMILCFLVAIEFVFGALF